MIKQICDICKKECRESDSLHIVRFNKDNIMIDLLAHNGAYISLELCDECYKKISKKVYEMCKGVGIDEI